MSEIEESQLQSQVKSSNYNLSFLSESKEMEKLCSINIQNNKNDNNVYNSYIDKKNKNLNLENISHNLNFKHDDFSENYISDCDQESSEESPIVRHFQQQNRNIINDENVIFQKNKNKQDYKNYKFSKQVVLLKPMDQIKAKYAKKIQNKDLIQEQLKFQNQIEDIKQNQIYEQINDQKSEFQINLYPLQQDEQQTMEFTLENQQWSDQCQFNNKEIKKNDDYIDSCNITLDEDSDNCKKTINNDCISTTCEYSAVNEDIKNLEEIKQSNKEGEQEIVRIQTQKIEMQDIENYEVIQTFIRIGQDQQKIQKMNLKQYAFKLINQWDEQTINKQCGKIQKNKFNKSIIDPNQMQNEQIKQQYKEKSDILEKEQILKDLRYIWWNNLYLKRKYFLLICQVCGDINSYVEYINFLQMWIKNLKIEYAHNNQHNQIYNQIIQSNKTNQKSTDSFCQNQQNQVSEQKNSQKLENLNQSKNIEDNQVNSNSQIGNSQQSQDYNQIIQKKEISQIMSDQKSNITSSQHSSSENKQLQFSNPNSQQKFIKNLNQNNRTLIRSSTGHNNMGESFQSKRSLKVNFELLSFDEVITSKQPKILQKMAQINNNKYTDKLGFGQKPSVKQLPQQNISTEESQCTSNNSTPDIQKNNNNNIKKQITKTSKLKNNFRYNTKTINEIQSVQTLDSEFYEKNLENEFDFNTDLSEFQEDKQTPLTSENCTFFEKNFMLKQNKSEQSLSTNIFNFETNKSNITYSKNRKLQSDSQLLSQPSLKDFDMQQRSNNMRYNSTLILQNNKFQNENKRFSEGHFTNKPLKNGIFSFIQSKKLDEDDECQNLNAKNVNILNANQNNCQNDQENNQKKGQKFNKFTEKNQQNQNQNSSNGQNQIRQNQQKEKQITSSYDKQNCINKSDIININNQNKTQITTKS
ncbi:hypothetical protein PPERSA_06727 [Pseudocohnilembus persalinus]|uniref:Uncharacterized protein n=1 Tax=Pseudocohnilembus persalinus TaxID=266149 RepID=A0A0V0QT23_PSEPJ|nr:hypothetical protein PPERSA_06727 [Pseudocohnilembus persalinus]|eukprot:KRX05093.1 hypothetical protein PPERSA_06727 [Pseudocohnilembus persalinus]